MPGSLYDPTPPPLARPETLCRFYFYDNVSKCREVSLIPGHLVCRFFFPGNHSILHITKYLLVLQQTVVIIIIIIRIVFVTFIIKNGRPTG